MLTDFQKKFIASYFNFGILALLILSIIFSRSFLGIYIYSFRIGELVIGSAFFFSLFVIFKNFKILSKFKLVNSLRSIFGLIIFYFVFLVFYYGDNIFNPVIYRYSSYIWVISFLFLGIFSSQYELNTKSIKYLEIILIYVYLTSIYGSLDFLVNFFENYSDKYELHKGSDLALVFIIFTLLINFLTKYNDLGFNLFLINISIYAPLFLFKSRAAFIGILIIFIYEFIRYLKSVKIFNKKKLFLYLLCIVLLTFSTIQSQTKAIPEEVNIKIISDSYSQLGSYKFSYYKEDMPFLYFEKNRIFSGDGNLNWRLDMWQDALEDAKDSSSLLLGMGYSEKYKVFLEDNTGYGNDRRGLDGLNENLHNYFLTILLRGGVLHFLSILFFNLLIIRNQSNNFTQLIVFIFTIYFISFFDSSMENAHFPIIFYYFLGYFFVGKSLKAK